MDMRKAMLLVESQTILSMVKPRFRVLDIGDLKDMASTRTCDDFAEKVGTPDTYEDLRSIWQKWNDNGDLESHRLDRFSIRHASGVARFIAEAIGATRYEKTVNHPFADENMMYGPGCYLLTCPSGRVFLDAMVHDRKVILSQLLVEGSSQKTGLGTKVMEAIHEFATIANIQVNVFKVVASARPFYSRFKWPETRDNGYSFVSTDKQTRHDPHVTHGPK